MYPVTVNGLTRLITYYNLDVVLTLGYRINSEQAKQFRNWATVTLKKNILKKDENLGVDYYKALVLKIKEIQTSEKLFSKKITDLYSITIDYNQQTAVRLFTKIQNIFHWAVTGKTADEIIVERANAKAPNMGLNMWKNYPHGNIQKSDVLNSLNYFSENELNILNKMLSMIFDFAILQAQRQLPMRMIDLENKINDILNISGLEVFSGKISIQTIHEHAINEYSKYIEKGSLTKIPKKHKGYIYFKKLQIENLRTFGNKQIINFTDINNKPFLWNIIIGDNGIGKTSILKALSLPIVHVWGSPEWKWNF